jgi:hypothetical protein
MDLNVLFVEDDETLGRNLIRSFDKMEIGGHVIRVQLKLSFEEGIAAISSFDYDIAILDLFQDNEVKDEEAGIKVLEKIRQSAFMPVIFYTGHAYKIKEMRSEIVGVVNKSEGIEGLSTELERIISSKLALIKKTVYSHLKESLRQYFWETVDTEKKIFKPGSNDASLGYLLLRRFANSLTKENIKQILGDDKIKIDNVHPMEFYIYPVNADPTKCEYQSGEILEKDGVYYAMLTPDCDLVLRAGGTRKADKVLLVATRKFKELADYKKYATLKSKSNRSEQENQQLSNLEGKLKTWMKNRGGDQDRFFFLPGTPFIENLIIDFQLTSIADYGDLRGFNRIAQLDVPFTQSMISSFIRYYNRIGSPDIDTDYVLNNL